MRGFLYFFNNNLIDWTKYPQTFFEQQDRKTAPSFTDLTELVAVVKTPNVPSSVLEKRARLFEYRSSGDEDSDQDTDQVDFFSRKRGGSLTEQDIMNNDTEYLSGMDEGGYEVCLFRNNQGGFLTFVPKPLWVSV